MTKFRTLLPAVLLMGAQPRGPRIPAVPFWAASPTLPAPSCRMGVIQVTNLATGITLKGVIQQEGNYYFPFLIPGIYRISVEKPGFQARGEGSDRAERQCAAGAESGAGSGHNGGYHHGNRRGPAARYDQRVGGPRDRFKGDARASAESRQPF